MAAQPNQDSTLVWHKASASGNSGGCVEVARSESSVLVRDSKSPAGAILEVTASRWRDFVQAIKTETLPGAAPRGR